MSTRGSAFNIRDQTLCQHGVVHSILGNKEDTASTRGGAFNIRYRTMCQHGEVHSISGR